MEKSQVVLTTVEAQGLGIDIICPISGCNTVWDRREKAWLNGHENRIATILPRDNWILGACPNHSGFVLSES
jgi:hypothetical protein